MSQEFPSSFNTQGGMTDFTSEIVAALQTLRSAFSGATRPASGLVPGMLHFNDTDGRLWGYFDTRGWGPPGWSTLRIETTGANVASADSVLFGDTSSAGFAYTLPEIDPPTSTDDLMDGRTFTFMNLGGNPLEIAPGGTDEIDGAAASVFLRRAGDWITLVGDLNSGGTALWRTLARGYAVGPLAINAASAANVGATEETLRTFTLPGGMLDADGKGVEIEAVLQMANNANAKQGRLMMEAVELVTTGSLTLQDTDVSLRARVFRTGSSAQRSIGSAGSNDGATLADKTQIASGTEDLSADVDFTLKATGVAADDVTAVFWRVAQI